VALGAEAGLPAALYVVGFKAAGQPDKAQRAARSLMATRRAIDRAL